ncbi:hypothetical protein ACTQ6A_00070 [Lachnospiraceae bacterium LCP25S3_G4]
MRILFCNIAWMDYYKGITKDDIPKGGGEYVSENQDAHEKYNFAPAGLNFEDEFWPDGEYCMGFVETKATSKEKRNQLHIEKISGCELCTKDDCVEDVLVIYCATHPSHGFTTVVGWYQHATVYRNYMTIDFESENGGTYWQEYNAIALRENCVLMPRSERSQILKWKVPRKNGGISYGFGRANIWFASEMDENENLKQYLIKLTKQIQGYNGENLIDLCPKE